MVENIDASEIETLLRELDEIINSPITDGRTNQRFFSFCERGTSNVDAAVSHNNLRTEKKTFATYANTTETDCRSTVVPLWERLPPLKPSEILSDEKTDKTQLTTRNDHKLLVHPTPLESSKPSLSRTVTSSILQSDLQKGSLDKKIQEEGDLKLLTQNKLLQPLPPIPSVTLSSPSSSLLLPFSVPVVAVDQEKHAEGTEGYKEANFLFIMCARYIHTVGITPRARWGQTLTPVLEDKLLLFGGMSIDEGETASLFEYDTIHLSWDPVFTTGTVVPTPRTNHAACTSGGGLLYIGGGTTSCGSRVLGDIYSYDVITQEWKCLWEYDNSSVKNKNEPTPRFAHSMLFRDDHLYVFGGKTVKRDSYDCRSLSSFSLASSDVYVFSLASCKWKKRISGTRKKKLTDNDKATNEEVVATPVIAKNATKAITDSRINRCFHAACLLDDSMYINGGVGDDGVILDDTWKLDLKKQQWILLHAGNSADAAPRERHHIFACGEALLVVGGCNASRQNLRGSHLRCHNFVSVLPLNGSDTLRPSWVSVAMGNASILSPSKKAFGAAFSGGFVHIFGGMCGSEPATNSMVRFLAADGYVATESRETALSSANGLTYMMRRMRAGSSVALLDTYILPRSWDGETVIDTLTSRPFGVHRVFVQHRAQKFWEDLASCRMEYVKAASSDIMRLSNELTVEINDIKKEADAAAAEGASSCGSQSNVVAYFTEGNSRVKGLSQQLSPVGLQSLLEYIYMGDVPWKSFSNVEDAEAKEGADNFGQKNIAQEEAVVIQSVRCAAEKYELHPLVDICDALLYSSHKKLREARNRSMKKLQDDLATFFENRTHATVTVLFVDPHTRQQVAHSLHLFILMAASPFFSDLLAPLISGEKTIFQIGSVAAKIRKSGRGSLQNRRGILVGPVLLPFFAVQPILRYLYTQQLVVPREAVFATMLGSHMLGVSQLQAYCESILSREEVNYSTACEFYSLAGKYGAALLQETALLTAVLGYAEVSRSPGYKALSEKEAHEIDAVALELNAATWVAPPQPVSEAKPTAVYQARWNASLS